VSPALSCSGHVRVPASSSRYSYDNESRLTQLVQNLNGTGSDLTLDFTLNPAGEIASTVDRNGGVYCYDGR